MLLLRSSVCVLFIVSFLFVRDWLLASPHQASWVARRRSSHSLFLSQPMSDVLCDLLELRRVVGLQLASSTRNLAKERRRGKQAQKRSEREWRLGEDLRRRALIMYALADYDAAPAMKLLDASGRKRHWPARSAEDLRKVVEDCFLEVDLGVFLKLSDKGAPLDAEAMRDASRYVEQWRLAAWAQKLNTEKGVAPSANLLLARLEERRSQLPPQLQDGQRGSAADNVARTWLRRWRARWGGRLAIMKPREVVPVEVLREKACV